MDHSHRSRAVLKAAFSNNDWPRPISTGSSSNPILNLIKPLDRNSTLRGEPWKLFSLTPFTIPRPPFSEHCGHNSDHGQAKQKPADHFNPREAVVAVVVQTRQPALAPARPESNSPCPPTTPSFGRSVDPVGPGLQVEPLEMALEWRH